MYDRDDTSPACASPDAGVCPFASGAAPMVRASAATSNKAGAPSTLRVRAVVFASCFWCFILLLCLVGCGAAPRLATPLERFEYRQRHMGVVARLVLYAPDSAAARQAASAAFARIAALNDVMSDYQPTSELMRLCQRAGGPPVPVSDDLFLVLRRAQALAARTDGAFDVTAGPYVRLWRTARRTGRLPPPESARAARRRVGWQHVRLDSNAQTVRLAVPGMQLDLGGLAKGYAADEALEALRWHGAPRALVQIGGDIVVGAPPPGRDGWRVALQHAPPGQRSVTLTHAALSSSGDTEQFVEIGGVRYSHVVDPRTGQGLTSRLLATVVAPDGLTADAFATTVSVLAPEARQSFAETHPEVSFFLRRVE